MKSFEALSHSTYQSMEVLINSLDPKNAIQLTLYLNQCIQYDQNQSYLYITHYTYTYTNKYSFQYNHSVQFIPTWLFKATLSVLNKLHYLLHR